MENDWKKEQIYPPGKLKVPLYYGLSILNHFKSRNGLALTIDGHISYFIFKMRKHKNCYYLYHNGGYVTFREHKEESWAITGKKN